MALTEAIGYYQCYHKEEYKDAQEKTRNLMARLKQLKYDYLYKPSQKKKQEGKMIKVQEENLK